MIIVFVVGASLFEGLLAPSLDYIAINLKQSDNSFLAMQQLVI
jgi:hypothetical protein